MAITQEVWTNQGIGFVTAGGTTAPSPGTSEPWTVNVTVALPPASPSAFPETVWFGYDPAAPTETLMITSCPGGTGTGQSFTVTRGADNSTPVAHSALGFNLVQCVAHATVASLQNRGLLWLSGGGTITTANITALAAASVPGLWLDPNDIWDFSGVVINAEQNFEIYMGISNGSIGWAGHVSHAAGYITTSTGSPADGIQVYASSPSSAQTQGIIFRNCVIVGNNSNAVVHFGGGQRRCGLVDTLVQNTNSAANSYAVIVDTALSSGNNSEDMVLSFTGGGGMAGGWAALGWNTGSVSGNANDTVIYACTTAGGTWSIVKNGGGGLTCIGAYDRSNPSSGNYNNQGGSRWTFIGGEHQNASGPAHVISGGETVLENLAVTATSSGNTTCTVSGGTLTMRGNCVSNVSQVIAVSGSGVVDMSDPAIAGSSFSVSGSAGTLVLAPAYPSGSRPVTSSWTGATVNTSGQKIPRDLSLLAWTCDPDAAGGGTFTPVTTDLYLCEFWVYEALTIGHVGITFVGTPTLTTGCYAGIYTAGATNFTNLATTADQSSAWTGSAGNKTAALSATLSPGSYYAALLLTGSAMGTVRAAAGAAVQLGNINLSGATLRAMIGGTGQTSLATLPVSGFNTTAPIFGMVFW